MDRNTVAGGGGGSADTADRLTAIITKLQIADTEINNIELQKQKVEEKLQKSKVIPWRPRLNKEMVVLLKRKNALWGEQKALETTWKALIKDLNHGRYFAKADEIFPESKSLQKMKADWSGIAEKFLRQDELSLYDVQRGLLNDVLTGTNVQLNNRSNSPSVASSKSSLSTTGPKSKGSNSGQSGKTESRIR